MTAIFAPVFLAEPFPLGYDPLVFHGSHFADGQYRVLFMVAGSHKELHKTADFATFAPVDVDWMPALTSNVGIDTFQDHVVLPDGTFVLYQNDGTEGATAAWTGTADDIDAGTITRQGRTVSTGGDCGCFYEAGADLIHIYTEDPLNKFGNVSSDRLLHFTTPADDLLTPTQHADAINTGGTWGTGDPCIIESGGSFWMFTDYTTAHPAYWIALYRSDDLYTWELVDETLTAPTGVRAGDFDVTSVGDDLYALSEYTGGNAGIGVWRLDRAARPSLRAEIPGRSVAIDGRPARLTVVAN